MALEIDVAWLTSLSSKGNSSFRDLLSELYEGVYNKPIKESIAKSTSNDAATLIENCEVLAAKFKEITAAFADASDAGNAQNLLAITPGAADATLSESMPLLGGSDEGLSVAQEKEAGMARLMSKAQSKRLEAHGFVHTAPNAAKQVIKSQIESNSMYSLFKGV